MTAINNVTRMLDAKKISHLAHVLPPEKFGALETSDLLGVDPHLMYKTIVARCSGGGKPVLGVLPGTRELDLKALAKALNEKKVKLATQVQAEEITGLQTGGISPLALTGRGFQVILDASAADLSDVYISGGQRGLIIRLAPHDLIALTSASFAKIAGYSP